MEKSVNSSDFDNRMKEIAEENSYSLGEQTEVTEEVESQDTETQEALNSSEEVDTSDTMVSDSEPEEATEDKLPKGFRKQLKRKERKIARQSEEMQQLKQELEQIKSQLSSNKPSEKKLTRENFRTDDEYIEHLTELKLNEKLENQQEMYQQKIKEQESYDELASTWEEKINDNFKSNVERDKYNELVTEYGDPSQYFEQDVIEYMFKNPYGPKMLNYFYERPSIINTINSMHNIDKADALRKIYSYVSKETPKKKVSNASAPVGSLSQSNSGAIKQPNEMTDDEKLKAYRAGKKYY